MRSAVENPRLNRRPAWFRLEQALRALSGAGELFRVRNDAPNGGNIWKHCSPVTHPDITHGMENMLYTEILPDDTDQPGITKQQFETAVSVWTWMQPGDEAPTVAATAASFNTTPEIVRQYVRASEWMFLEGPDDDPTKQRVETREAGEQESPRHQAAGEAVQS